MAHGLSGGDPGIEELKRFAATHQLGPLLSCRKDHATLRNALPESLRQDCQEGYVRQWLTIGSLVHHLHQLHLAFSGSGRDFLLLKGPYLAERFYGDLGRRRFEDQPTNRPYALWSYRLALYDMLRSIALAQLLLSAPIRVLFAWMNQYPRRGARWLS